MTTSLGAATVTDRPASPLDRIQIGINLWWRISRDNWLIFRSNRLAMVGLGLLILFGILALFHPILLNSPIMPRTIYHPETGYDIRALPWPALPSSGHPLGVDSLGRDNLSRLMAATRPTFTLAITAAIATALISTLIGAFSAYYRGLIDFIFTHLADGLLLMPAPVVMVILGVRFWQEMTAVRFGLFYGLLVGAGGAAIVMRAQALMLSQRTFIESARVSGAGGLYIIFRHLIPHMLPLAFAHMMTAVVGAVVADGFVAFFGLRLIRLNWGLMVYDGMTWMRAMPANDIPWIPILMPALALSLFAAAFYFISRGLHDIAEPRLRGDRTGK
jgi:peptide/nickel transport system permease protein